MNETLKTSSSQQRGQITAAMDTLQAEIERCEVQAKTLEERLSEVLASAGPTEGPKDAAAFDVPLAKRIQQSCFQVERLTDLLQSLNSRLSI